MNSRTFAVNDYEIEITIQVLFAGTVVKREFVRMRCLCSFISWIKSVRDRETDGMTCEREF